MIDYERAFNKLVEQIRIERKWADEEPEDEHRFVRGMRFAYMSIGELAEQLANDTFDYDWEGWTE